MGGRAGRPKKGTRKISGETLTEAEISNIADNWLMAAGRCAEIQNAGDIEALCLANARRLLRLTGVEVEGPSPVVVSMGRRRRAK